MWSLFLTFEKLSQLPGLFTVLRWKLKSYFKWAAKSSSISTYRENQGLKKIVCLF